ncbi:MAG: hypothetical protein QM582_01155 [Micropruina sp.]|uniref:hypothetical protein n=1 Tax=Micropruina sp. TaxID=2737536 RepID=UPI0039E6CEB0
MFKRYVVCCVAAFMLVFAQPAVVAQAATETTHSAARPTSWFCFWVPGSCVPR